MAAVTDMGGTVTWGESQNNWLGPNEFVRILQETFHSSNVMKISFKILNSQLVKIHIPNKTK